MEYIKLGATGLDVSPVCLGTMSFGDDSRGKHRWALDEERSLPVLRHAMEHGINFLDTANVYSAGASERIVGRAIREYARRDEIVLATKVFNRMSPGPNGAGLSRKAILAELDKSLERLGVDYVDLYMIHRFDHSVPVEETLSALDDVVRAGKVRYIAASSMYARQFSRMLHLAESRGWSGFVAMQSHLNLLYREEEREMLPLCAERGVGVLAWSPLARGLLGRPWGVTTRRSELDDLTGQRYGDGQQGIVNEVQAVAAERGIPMAQVALAWFASRSPQVIPVFGATTTSQVDDAIAATSVTLTAAEVARPEKPYVPRPVIGHS